MGSTLTRIIPISTKRSSKVFQFYHSQKSNTSVNVTPRTKIVRVKRLESFYVPNNNLTTTSKRIVPKLDYLPTGTTTNDATNCSTYDKDQSMNDCSSQYNSLLDMSDRSQSISQESNTSLSGSNKTSMVINITNTLESNRCNDNYNVKIERKRSSHIDKFAATLQHIERKHSMNVRELSECHC